MPYVVEGNCVKKNNTGETVKCHETHEKALAHLRALEANVNDSLVEMSMRITKASYNKSEKTPMRWAAIDSDIDEDLYQERMSLELYQDFERRIKDNEPIPADFQEAVCEVDWCGGMPYLSIAHYKSGSGKVNVPGEVESVFIDGTRLKSRGTLHDSPMGRKVFDALREDLYMEKSGKGDHLPVRISIGFLDLEHKHRLEGQHEVTFVRDEYGKICPLCASGVGGKIYTKGHLIHLALTRVPANPRTQMSVEKSMDEITSKRQDAESIIGELADGLEEKSISSEFLVVRSEEEQKSEVGSTPKEVESPLGIEGCYDPNTNSYSQECVDAVMDAQVGTRDPNAVKSFYDAVQKSLSKIYTPTEEDMATKKKSQVENPPVEEKPIEEPVMKSEMEEDEEDEEEMEEKSALDVQFEQLKSALTAGKSVKEVQEMFNALGKEVEKSYKAPAPTVTDIAEIVKSAIAEAVQPLAVEIATLKAQVKNAPAQVERGVVASKALSFGGVTPEQLLKKSSAPTKKLSQIEQIAYKSTGALKE